MVHFLDANATDIAMTGPRRPVYITSHAKFDAINFDPFRYNIGDLNMTLDMLIFRNNQKIALHFIFFILNYD